MPTTISSLFAVCKVTLDGLTNILQVGYRGKTQPNEFHGIFEACGGQHASRLSAFQCPESILGLEKFEMLQMHPSAALAERSTVMIETFLSWTEEMETGYKLFGDAFLSQHV